MEFWCPSVHVNNMPFLYWNRYDDCEEVASLDQHDLYGLVDVAAWKDGKLWAFEVKHIGDKVKTAILQTQNYARYFDYSCAFICDFKELIKNRKAFQDLGVGTYYPDAKGISVLDEPKLQTPVKSEHDRLYDKFLRNTGMKKATVVSSKANSLARKLLFQRQQQSITQFTEVIK